MPWRPRDMPWRAVRSCDAHRVSYCRPHTYPQISVQGALLLPWYLGVVNTLVEERVINPQTTPGAGLSGGAVTAMNACAGKSPKDLFNQLKPSLVSCYETWDPESGSVPCNGQLSEIVYEGFASLLNASDPTQVADICPHVGIAFTNIDPSDSTFGSIESRITANYSSDEDILRDLVSTSFLSCSSMSHPYFVNKGRATVDGGYSTNLKELCGGTTDSCLTIQVYYPNTTEDGPVCTRQDTSDPSVGVELLSECLKEAGGSYNSSAAGPPAPAWANFTEIGDLPTTCPGGPTQFMPPGEADIYPGKYVPLNYSCFEWQCMAYIPYPERLDDLYSLGEREARAWIQDQLESVTNGSSNVTGSTSLPSSGDPSVATIVVPLALLAACIAL